MNKVLKWIAIINMCVYILAVLIFIIYEIITLLAAGYWVLVLVIFWLILTLASALFYLQNIDSR